jgi:hypothetical protein
MLWLFAADLRGNRHVRHVPAACRGQDHPRKQPPDLNLESEPVKH